MSMTYQNRMMIAVFLSVLLHAAGFGVLQYSYTPRPAPPPPESAPIIVNLQPEPEPEQTPSRQLVDVAVPAPEPPDPTDRIAETNAEAMTLARRPDAAPAPALEADTFDALPAPPSPPEEPAPAPVEPPLEQAPPEEEPEPAETPARKPSPERATPPVEEMDLPLETVEIDEPAEAEEPAPEPPMQVARAMPAPPQRPSPGRAREQGGGARQGATNFSAIQHEIAPYLKHVRQLVERQWNEMIYTRYSGTSPVRAVIDCAINPQGELVSVTVVEPDRDRLYSALCRDAVQRAGPFGPFTFEVPEIYRNQNLEIRWTFNFL